MWQKYLKQGLIQKVAANEEDIKKLLQLADRDRKDAYVEALSIDRRFATAYNAAYTLTRAYIVLEGYRITSQPGHHRAAFDLLLAMGGRYKEFAVYFDFCRRKRNQIDYFSADVISATDLEEILTNLDEFFVLMSKKIK